MIEVNYKREKDTYSKIFNSKISVTEQVAKAAPKPPPPTKTTEEKEFEKEEEQIDNEVHLMVQRKMGELSFEVKAGWEKLKVKEAEDI